MDTANAWLLPVGLQSVVVVIMFVVVIIFAALLVAGALRRHSIAWGIRLDRPPKVA